jgi:hypothetical protein
MDHKEWEKYCSQIVTTLKKANNKEGMKRKKNSKEKIE